MAEHRQRQRRSTPLAWTAALTVGILLLGGAAVLTRRLAGEGTAPPPTAGPTAPHTTLESTPEPGANLAGPLNLLLVGVDTRVSVPGWEPHADAVMIMHVTETLDRAYLFALPRDLLVDVPALPAAGFAGAHTKLTHAMSYGSRRLDRAGEPDTAQGFDLLETTVGQYTGIGEFDAGAVLTFGGFTQLVDALGGVDLDIDQRVVSLHRQPDGKHRKLVNGTYVGPQMIYEPGRRHLAGWQALDYARQRYQAGGTYSRQRHHQQLIKALVGRVRDADLARDPDRLTPVLAALNETLTFQGRGQRVLDFAFALSELRPEAITLVALPGRSVGGGADYRGERLEPVADDFLAALRAGQVADFLAEHPHLLIEG